MAIYDKELDETIKEISFNIIEKTAPEERDMFDEISQTYFSNPALLDKANKKTKDDPVGFGMEGMVEMLTPATISVVTTVVGFIGTEVFGAVKGALTEELKTKIKSLFNKDKKSGNKDIVQLTPGQLKEVHDKALKEGIGLNLSQEQANNLANALISSMVINQ